MTEQDPRVRQVEVLRSGKVEPDLLAVEEPLEIHLAYCDPEGALVERSISITMRTPGNDWELAVGFLHGEGIIDGAKDLRMRKPPLPERPGCNVVRVPLADSASFDPKSLQRHFYTSSSCGVCGKASLEALRQTIDVRLRPGHPRIRREIVAELPTRLRAEQPVFERTGGLHAAGIFDVEGRLQILREDVGRHNAVDKAVGRALLDDRLPLSESILMVSGRTSFEILQKALAAGIPIVAAVSAPSSLAVEMACEYGLTLCGFVRDGAFNIYHDDGRILGDGPS